jgi:hypothetical protein
MNFSEAARKTLKDPCAIRRVEEANPDVDPISEDDILNLKIDLALDSESIFLKKKKVVRCKFIEQLDEDLFGGTNG